MKITPQHRLQISQGRVFDPSQNIDGIMDIFIENDSIVAIGKAPKDFVAEATIDASNQLVIPGLIDLLAYLPEPGYSHKGSIHSETQAASRSGITTLLSSPDSKPVVDSAAVAQLVEEKARYAGFCHVIPLGALTAGLEGEQLSNMHGLKEAGCIALTQLDLGFKDNHVIKQCYHYAAGFDIPVIITPIDRALAQDGNLHEGATSSRLGLAGVSESAETCALAQHLILAKETGVKLHVSRITTATSLDMIRQAQAQGINVTADVALGNLVFTDEDALGYDSLMHVKPVYRCSKTQQALLQGVEDGVLSICSNHRPHEVAAKMAPFSASEAGISCLDSFTSVLLSLVEKKKLTLSAAVKAVTSVPAQQMGLPKGQLKMQAEANLAIIDLHKPSCLQSQDLYSKGKNNPWVNQTLNASVTCTVKQGQIVYRA
ncbi:dihydroorotase [Bermanella sp. R86510]|uniref:dihydroorotase n=1 Tax=unclassified Bermanella TaxID=2627862 RepID=UPI0037C6113C